MKSIKVAFLSLLGAATVVSPSFAADWTEQFGLCVSAAEAEGIADSENYDAKFISGGGAATKRIIIKFISNNGGSDLTAECRIRGSDVKDVTLES